MGEIFVHFAVNLQITSFLQPLIFLEFKKEIIYENQIYPNNFISIAFS